MSAIAIPRSFECAPHAARSAAMAITLAFNFAIVLYALLPSTPYPVRTPPPRAMSATVVPPLPPVAAPIPVPTLPVTPHVSVATVHIAIQQPASLDISTIPTIVSNTSTQANAIATLAPVTGAGDSSASVAYETATPPAYPILAAREQVQGTVLLKVLVDASGTPVDVRVEQTSGSRLLDDAARRHVLAAWRFHPAMRGGHAIETWALVPVRFSLNHG